MPEAISESSVIAEATKVASAVARIEDLKILTLSNGIKLKVSAVPPLAIREAAIMEPPPQVPIQMLESKGREEPNPLDPEYGEMLAQYQSRQLARSANVMMLLGTTVEFVPDGLEPPESDEWTSMLEATGITLAPEVYTNKHARRLAWIKFYAVRAETEISMLLAKITALSGVTELEVQRAAAAFLRAS